MKTTPTNAIAFITSSEPVYLDILVEGQDVFGDFEIQDLDRSENPRKYRFEVLSSCLPKATIYIYDLEDLTNPELIISTHFGFNPDSFDFPGNRLVLKCFLLAWHAKRGHIPEYVDRPVPYPLPPELKAGGGGSNEP